MKNTGINRKFLVSKLKTLWFGLGLSLSNSLIALAGENDGDPVEWIKTTDNGMFSGFNESAKGFFGSAYTTFGIVGSALAVFALMTVAFQFWRGGRHVDEAKDRILAVIFGIAIAGGAVSIVSLIYGIFG